MANPSMNANGSLANTTSTSTSTSTPTPTSTSTSTSTPLKCANRANPISTPFKPRLLWRGHLTLTDGTILDGIAFLSHQHPFLDFQSPSHPKLLNPPQSHHTHHSRDAMAEQEAKADAEAEAEMSLALEMVRHRPLALETIIKDPGHDLKSQDQANGRARGNGKNENEKKKQQEREKEKEKENGMDSKVSYRSTGSIRMYIDPTCSSTIAYFERHFCTSSKLAATSPPRTSTIIHISLEPSFSSSSATPQADVFSDSLSFSHNAAMREKAGIQAVIFGRLEETESGDATPSMALVLGRKVMERKKEGNLKGKPRPDDPLPRGNLFLQGLVQSKSFNSTSSLLRTKYPPNSRSSSPFSLSLPPQTSSIEASNPRVKNLKPEQNGTEKTRRKSGIRKSVSSSLIDLTPVKEEIVSQEGDSPIESRNPTSTLNATSKRVGSGRTPGRRGEKRPLKLNLSTDSQSDGNGKRRKADEITLLNESSAVSERNPMGTKSRVGHLRIKREESLGLNSDRGLDSPTSPTGSSFSRAGTPNLLQTSTSLHSSSDNFRSSSSIPPEFDSKSSMSKKEEMNPIEIKNRSTIKKLVHHQLLGRGLEKKDRDFVDCWNATCTGTSVALRHQIKVSPINRSQAAQIINSHLSIYLDSNFSIPPTSNLNASSISHPQRKVSEAVDPNSSKEESRSSSLAFPTSSGAGMEANPISSDVPESGREHSNGNCSSASNIAKGSKGDDRVRNALMSSSDSRLGGDDAGEGSEETKVDESLETRTAAESGEIKEGGSNSFSMLRDDEESQFG